MLTFLQQFLHDKSGWELLAVSLSIIYLALAIRENLWCWPAAFISALIYTGLFWHVSLLMDSALNVYYMLMAVYGMFVWRSLAEKTGALDEEKAKDKDKEKAKTNIVSWPMVQHFRMLALIVVLSLTSGYLLTHHSNAEWPYLNSFTSWASVITTYMVAKKILENWLYWIAIDAVAIGLYIERGLYPTAMLFALYFIMAMVGYLRWRKQFRRRNG